MATLAPNLWSWVSSDVWTYEAETDLDTDARDQRLVELRRHFGFSDDELIRHALSRSLPQEPGIAEWLVLLGQGALLAPEES